MTTDFRALCAEMLRAWEKGDDIVGPMNRARAALAADPQGPTDEEMDEWIMQHPSMPLAEHMFPDTDEWAYPISNDDVQAFVRDALARWEQP